MCSLLKITKHSQLSSAAWAYKLAAEVPSRRLCFASTLRGLHNKTSGSSCRLGKRLQKPSIRFDDSCRLLPAVIL
ncbi:unnamed protein product [Protopolystoma xenopodis]|uniref:Uncharacterized protein n=1 Tax=Protopolystoma xenopodis TaxID=117903 RepID=A0A3S5A9Q9_9PLAT|nr:unnamed protein product [Protopolystoma xenopodis]